MGSGCTKNTYNKCTDSDATSSHCVSWQGEAYPLLGICTGDSITEVTEVIISKLDDIAEGEGITLKDLDITCDSVKQKIAQTDGSLHQITEYILNNQCTLQDAIDALKVTVDENSIVTVDTECLGTGITTQTQLWTAMIQKVCDLADQISALTQGLDDLTSGNDDTPDLVTTINNLVGDALINRLTNCNNAIIKNGTGASATLEFRGMIPVGGMVFGKFDLSKFNSDGVGQDIYCGFGLADGKGGRPNMPGKVPAMYDTSNPINSVKGSTNFKILEKHLPAHQHQVIDPGHSHSYVNWPNQAVVGGGSGTATRNSGPVTKTSGSSQTGIVVAGLENLINEPIDLRQPTYYGVWIVRIN